MAIAFRAASTLVDNGTATSIIVTQPAGLTTGDLVIVNFVSTGTTSVIIAPPDSSWYRMPLEDYNGNGDNVRSSFYYHVATNFEPTWLFELGASVHMVSVSVAYSGVSTIDIVGLSEGTSGTATAPVVTPNYSGGTLLQFVSNNQSSASSAVTLNGALTSRFNLTNGASKITLAMGDAAAPAVGVPSTAYTNTLTTSAWFVAVVILNPTSSTIPVTATDIGVVPNATFTTSGLINAGSGSVPATVPSGIQNGDILVAFYRLIYIFGGNTVSGAPTITPPAGWTQVRTDFFNPSGGTGFAIQAGVYTHAVTSVGSEPGTYTWSANAHSDTIDTITVAMGTIRGCSAIDQIAESQSTTEVTTLTTTGVSCTDANEPILIWSGWSSDSGGPTAFSNSLQQETNSAAQGLYSTIGGLAATTTPAYVVNTSGNPWQVIAYQVSFLPNVANSPKIVGSTVINAYSSVNSVTINTPTSPSTPVTGDLLLAHITVNTGVTITPPGTWTLVINASVDDGTKKCEVYYRVVPGSVPVSTTFNFSGSSTGAASIIAFHNVGTTGLTASNSTVQGQTPSLSNIESGSIVLMYEMCDNNPAGSANTVQPPTSMIFTPFSYNSASYSTGAISFGGALGVLLQTGPAGGVIGKQYRVASGSNIGPQITIAIPGPVAPPPPPPPPPIPPPPGPGPNLPFVYRGRIAQLTNIPPIKNWHDLNKVLQKKFVQELPQLFGQLTKYAANPQQHYKVVAQALPTVEQTDVTTSEETSGAPAPIVSSDTANTFSGTGYITTQGPLVSAGTLSIPSATPTALTAASPNTPFNSGDTAYLQVNGTFASGMNHVLIDLTVMGNPSSQTYAGFTTTTDGSGNFAVTQQFNVQPATPVSNDASVTVSITQSTGGTVTLSVYNVSIGNLQQR